MSAQPKQVARRFFDEVLNQRRMDAPSGHVAESVAFHSPVLEAPLQGRDAFAGFIAGLHANFSGLRYELRDLVAEDDRVLVSWECRGQLDGAWMGIPGNGRGLTMTGFDLLTIADARIHRFDVQADYLGALRQLGLTPKP